MPKAEIFIVLPSTPAYCKQMIILADVADSQTAASWLAAGGTWFAAIASTVVAAAAIFGDWIRGLFFKPKCILECGTSDALWHSLNDPSGMRWRQIRLRIVNTGNAPAREVEVHVLDVIKINGAKKATVGGFVPARLKWTHGGPIARTYLAPNTFAFVDFGSLSPLPTVHPQLSPAQLSLNVEVPGTNLWVYGGGTYEFEIGVVTSSGYLRRSVFDVSFEDKWMAITDKVAVMDANFSIKQKCEIDCGAE